MPTIKEYQLVRISEGKAILDSGPLLMEKLLQELLLHDIIIKCPSSLQLPLSLPELHLIYDVEGIAKPAPLNCCFCCFADYNRSVMKGIYETCIKFINIANRTDDYTVSLIEKRYGNIEIHILAVSKETSNNQGENDVNIRRNSTAAKKRDNNSKKN